jgi:hypothetical protein
MEGMEENPYRAPATAPEPLPSALCQPNRALAVCCFCFAALFVFMFAVAARNATWTFGNAIMLGWVSLTSVGFGAIALGMWVGRRSPTVVGACIVLLSLATMFTLVISFPGL